jgi:hypothetical protein
MVKLKLRYMCNEKGEKIGVVLSCKEFEKLIDEVEDWIDFDYITKHGGKKTGGIPFEEVIAKTEKSR